MSKRITAPGLSAIKARGEKITMLTAYDYPSGSIADEAGVDVVLVGDSLGMVVLGYDTTLQVTMEDMVRHTAAVSRGVKRALIVADMPFMSYQVNDEEALRNAARLIVEGNAHAVKIEGGNERIAETMARIVAAGIPVVGHLGMTPQSVNVFGGFVEQGKDEWGADRIKRAAKLLEESGACAIVLEKIPSDLAAEITSDLEIPTIGIGAGPHCDGQVLVMHDVLGLYDKFVPPFAKQYAQLRKAMLDAFSEYNREVKSGEFPRK